MRLFFYHAPAGRQGGAVLSDLTQYEFWDYTRQNWYTDIMIVNSIDVPPMEAVKLRASGNIKTLFRVDIAKKGL